MRLFASVVAVGLALGGCTLDWGSLDPREGSGGATTSVASSTTTASGPAGGGGASGSVAAVGVGGAGGEVSAAGGSGGADPCGDGTVEGAEQCDDGNPMPGDGCDETCQVECPVDGLFDPMTHHCYVYLPSGMSWSSARTSCLALGPGVDLAALSSAAELSFVEVWTPVATRLSNGLNVWLGGEETAVENVFVWTNGEPFDDSLWNLDEPNNSGMVDEECVDLRRKNGTNGLNDDECIAVAHVLCERTPAGT